MSEHPLELSARLIDNGIVDTPPNRVTQELSELADGISIIESFSHVVVVNTGDGLVTFDASGAAAGPAVVESLRAWSDEPVHSIVYTHGHLDHVGGSRAFAADAEAKGRPTPRVVGHEAVQRRFDRYTATAGYNSVINRRQFGGGAVADADTSRPFLPVGTLGVDTEYQTNLTETIGGVTFEYEHCKGETDDHTWTWLPEHKMISAGDQFIWNFPNCGNPQKVQRYPVEWAESLRAMAATLDSIINEVRVPAETLSLPYLRPLYDEPEFVIRNIWRLYGGWYDGNPARLKPPADAAVGAEVAGLAGGGEALIARATELSGAGDHRLACQIIEFAAAAEPESHAVHEARSQIYSARRGAETSLMAKGIYLSAKAESDFVVTGEVPATKLLFSLGED